MRPFLYRCPDTGQKVQTWAADDPDDDDLTYVQVNPGGTQNRGTGQ